MKRLLVIFQSRFNSILTHLVKVY